MRVFTIEEAQGLIPRLRRLLDKVSHERDRILALKPEIERARKNAEAGGGGSLTGPAYIKRLFEFSKAIKEIEVLGVVVKDFGRGLVDFPHERDGRIVFLCWKPDEEQIGWWHEVDTGFAGRLPLADNID